MDQLLSIPRLSIAELKKVLSDNDIKDTSTSRSELVQLVSDTLLTNMMLDELQEESAKELQAVEDVSKIAEQERVTHEREQRQQLQQQQDQEYQESVRFDSLEETMPINYIDIYEGSHTSNDGDLSPNSLRAARIERFE